MADIEVRQPEKPHPLSLDAYRLYVSHGNQMTDDVLETIENQLEPLWGDMQQAFDALVSLEATSMMIRSSGDTDNAERLHQLIIRQAPRFEGIKEQLQGEQQDMAENALLRMAQMFGGQGVIKQAPSLDETAPEGSQSVKDLLPNPALVRPPQVKKKK